MGCTQSITKHCKEKTDTLQFSSNTTWFHPNGSGSESLSYSDKKNSDSDSSLESSSNESFSVSKEFENEDEISKIYCCVADECENKTPTCLFLNHFQDSSGIYQQVHWREVHRRIEKHKAPKTIAQELKDLSEFIWYWGPMSSKEAEQELQGKPDGSFLVRDSANSRHLLSVSFRSRGSCCHTRIQCRNKKFSFANEEGKDSVIELLRKSMATSKEGVLFYSRRQIFQDIWFPVRLLHPVSRMTKVPSLQYLCRFVIRKNIRCDKLHELPLPKSMIEFLHGNYFREETN